MPWLDDSVPATHPAQEWKIILKKAFQGRLPGRDISRILLELSRKFPAQPKEIAHVLLHFRARRTGGDDPLLFSYARALLDMKLIQTSHLLLALLDTSVYVKRPDFEQHDDRPSTGFPTCEERMFNLLTQIHMSGASSHSPPEIHGLVYTLTRWMHVVTEYEMGKQLEGGALHAADAFAFGMYEALASLVFTILSSETFRDVAKQPWWKKRRGTVVSEMENFDSHVLQWMQSQLGGRLRALATMPPFIETDSDGRPVFTDQQILQTISDLPIVNSRAGLFVWLNASLCSRPLMDDLSMLAYLQNRYPGDNQSLTSDLLISSFDVLTNALLQKETEQNLHVVKSFICNKLPLLLNIVSGFMAPAMTAEACIQMAFMTIPMDALPPISAGSNEVRAELKLTRLNFLQACGLHGLVSENTISNISQEPPISLSRSNKYTKEALFAQCSANVARLEPLIDELAGMVGNAGAIAGCIVDIVNSLCTSKDTMSLKTVCNMMIKKTSSLDIIMQYTQPAGLLFPLCSQLNGWIHDQDQTEFTPAYEEFASILLFVFVVVHRYGLARADLGLPNDDDFVVKLLQETSVSKSSSDLTDDQSRQLGKWIEGLYATDEHGESSGISDDVMRQCPPQAFYQLVPTLFEQSVLACKSGSLSMKTFKGGLELLVEPFLLPSLVGGLSWIIKHSWEDHGDADTLLQILDRLLKPSSSSEETKAMHRAILGIVAKPLYESLQNLSEKQPNKKQVNGCMEILKPYLDRQRTLETGRKELEEWVVTTDGGVNRRIQNTIRDLVSWVSSVGPTPPPGYTHKLLAAGSEAIGVNATRDAIISELRNQTHVGSGPLALDVCTAMVAAPLPSSQAPILNLGSAPAQMQAAAPSVRDAVRLYTNDLKRLLHIETSEAEALVRLGRRVEAQLAITQMPQLPMAMPMQDEATDQMMADLGLTDEALAAPGGDTSMDQMVDLGPDSGAGLNNADLTAMLDQSIDLANTSAQNIGNMSTGPNALPGDSSQDIFGDMNMEMTQPSQLNVDDTNLGVSADGQQNAEEDIFAGLDMDLGEDFNFS